MVPLWGVRPDSPRLGRGDAGSSARLPVAPWLPRRSVATVPGARTAAPLSHSCLAGVLHDNPHCMPTRMSAHLSRKPALREKSEKSVQQQKRPVFGGAGSSRSFLPRSLDWPRHQIANVRQSKCKKLQIA